VLRGAASACTCGGGCRWNASFPRSSHRRLVPLWLTGNLTRWPPHRDRRARCSAPSPTGGCGHGEEPGDTARHREDTGPRQIMSFGMRVWGERFPESCCPVDQALMTPLSDSYELGLYAVAATIADIP